VWRDWVLMAVVVPAAVLEGALRPALPFRALSVAVIVALMTTLLWRRTWPLLMVSLTPGASAVLFRPAEPGASRHEAGAGRGLTPAKPAK
jgi:hypothetical protein